ncbi:uncharacterized protein LOC129287629 isoform X2 [Prosopis cineraria]|uniref:uncharacterized protein LOC129287629 isoform X2 n=1 Tax=Prosopis cineraria TaxID=364024 RepID=UPI00240FDB1F|nr:uncharacterized protein LOC129287629 isoform X2 [Prosopis cineraria]
MDHMNEVTAEFNVKTLNMMDATMPNGGINIQTSSTITRNPNTGPKVMMMERHVVMVRDSVASAIWIVGPKSLDVVCLSTVTRIGHGLRKRCPEDNGAEREGVVDGHGSLAVRFKYWDL